LVIIFLPLYIVPAICRCLSGVPAAATGTCITRTDAKIIVVASGWSFRTVAYKAGLHQPRNNRCSNRQKLQQRP